GTGKELAAARLHFLSPRWQAPLVALNCAALAPTLIEDELFGHEAGAFTGAAGRRAGRFESAHGGTLFLDEIGNIPLTAQEKILRVVEYGVFERVGGTRPVEADVRVVAATHADLPALARQGRFKEDLLDRLSFEVLALPPLRARGEDVLLLARHFAARMASQLGRGDTPSFTRQAEDSLLAHAWPGNVRELKNVVERAVYRSESSLIADLDFDPFAATRRWPGASEALQDDKEAIQSQHKAPSPQEPFDSNLLNFPYKEAVAQLERRLLKHALKEARFNQRQAAERLGLTYHQLRAQIKKHGGPQGL
ncbi:sigma 54-interacting transcriptional regulator, partial [Patescibacteria group bacterium]|nr:sigma 54-interacting transcriptional regulator [Patescibacteria group bacterium]MBU1449262.1 sigma 54-interacting transcriptional regulator [Patescibacteria group bacterium]